MVSVLSLACAGGVEDESNASGPGQQLSLGEYFHELSGAFDTLEEAAERGMQPPEAGTPEELLRLFQDSTNDLESSAIAFINEVEVLKPPKEAAAAHEEFLEALRSDHQRISALAKNVREADSIEDAMAAFQAGAGLVAKSREPCRRLQAIARQQNIGVDLPCED
jgi:hypothetical protein